MRAQWALILVLTGAASAAEPVIVDAGLRSLHRCEPDQLAARAADDIWLADRCGHLFRSADSGDHWRPVVDGPASLLPSGHRVIALLWLSESEGLFVASTGAFARTTDGGKRWQPGRLSIPGPILAAARAGERVWFCNAASQLLRSDDGGASFTPRSLPFREGCGTLSFSDADHGFAAASAGPRQSWGASARGAGNGDYGASPELWRTDDGGVTWDRTAPFPRALPRIMAARETAQIGWVFGETSDHRSVVLGTFDGGSTWSENSIPHPETKLLTVERNHVWTSQMDLVHERPDYCRPHPLRCQSTVAAEAATFIDDRRALVIQEHTIRRFEGDAYQSTLQLATSGAPQPEPLLGRIDGRYQTSPSQMEGKHVVWGWSRLRLYRSDDDGHAWAMVREAPEPIAGVILVNSPHQLLIRFESGRLRRASFDGSPWQPSANPADLTSFVLTGEPSARHASQLACLAIAHTAMLSIDLSGFGDFLGRSEAKLRLEWSPGHAVFFGKAENQKPVRRELSEDEARALAKRLVEAAQAGQPKEMDEGSTWVTTLDWRCDDRPRQATHFETEAGEGDHGLQRILRELR